MLIKIDFESETPIYIQLKEQIIRGIASGELKEGENLPSVRQMASDIGINLHTVNKADNFISIDRRKGALVNPISKSASQEYREELYEELLTNIVVACCNGMDEEEYLKICKQYLNITKRRTKIMSEKTISLLTILPIFFIILILQLIMPKLTRKEIYFGVRIPEDEINNPKLKSVYKSYIRNMLCITLPYILTVSIILIYKYITALFSIGLLGLLLIDFLIYYNANRKTLAIKIENAWNINKKQVVVIDTKFTKDKNNKTLASPWWFLIPAILITINVYLCFKNYDTLPDKIPTHWNSLGEVNEWVTKSYKTILILPIVQSLISIIMFFNYKTNGWAKQQINAKNPKASLLKNKKFRFMWSIFVIFSTIMINLILTLINLTTLQIIDIKGKAIITIILIPIVLILIGSIALSVITGQGGSRLILKNNINHNNNLTDRNDDRYWKLGRIYFNPNDPAVFVEKRFGIGFTINFGRIEGILLSLVTLIIILLLVFLPKLLN
jgi:uncharacterized membrane protein/DNA-binding transcriptional regulator YhcF (GntR family)